MSEKKTDPQQNHDPQEAGAENTNAQEAQHDKNRREVLQKILIGGGIAAGSAMLPDKWTRPVVDTIIAPAHAATSTTTSTTSTTTTTTTTTSTTSTTSTTDPPHGGGGARRRIKRP